MAGLGTFVAKSLLEIGPEGRQAFFKALLPKG
jgi:hypothetical protein